MASSTYQRVDHPPKTLVEDDHRSFTDIKPPGYVGV